MRRIRDAQGVSFPQKTVMYVSVLFIVPEAFFIVLHFFYPHPFFAVSMFVGLIFLGIPAIIIWAMFILRVVLIRKDCNNCQFRFHIIAHEMNHLKLNSLDENRVEEETLKQTGERLFPIILSNPELCKDCGFRKKRYIEAAAKYLIQKQRKNSTTPS
jgi:hypothetical protein